MATPQAFKTKVDVFMALFSEHIHRDTETHAKKRTTSQTVQ